MWCKHKWTVLVNNYDKSPVERIVEIRRATPQENFESRYNKNFSYLLTQLEGTRIIILCCDKCGKINKTIEKV